LETQEGINLQHQVDLAVAEQVVSKLHTFQVLQLQHQEPLVKEIVAVMEALV
jgi:hypothetical protein